MPPNAGTPGPAGSHPSSSRIRAVIDVGTNSVKLLIGRVERGVVTPLLERSEQTRLGEGFFAQRILQPAAIRRTAEVVERFSREALRFQPDRLRIIATAAAREASNRDDLITALALVSRAGIEVISGDAEAELAFRGVCSSPLIGNRPLLVTDVGGGSTEFILGQAGQRHFSRSFPLGAVRLHEAIGIPPDPSPEHLRRCREHVANQLAAEVTPLLPVSGPAGTPADWTFVGVGGTIVIVARLLLALTDYDRERIEATEISAYQLTELTARLWSMPLEQRRQLPGLPPERADIILTGLVIYEAITRAFALPSVRPSTRGLRFAALLSPPPLNVER